MNNTELVTNLKKINTLVVNKKEYEPWVALTLQEVIATIEQREKDLLVRYAIPSGWTGTVNKKITE